MGISVDVSAFFFARAMPPAVGSLARGPEIEQERRPRSTEHERLPLTSGCGTRMEGGTTAAGPMSATEDVGVPPSSGEREDSMETLRRRLDVLIASGPAAFPGPKPNGALHSGASSPLPTDLPRQRARGSGVPHTHEGRRPLGSFSTGPRTCQRAQQ